MKQFYFVCDDQEGGCGAKFFKPHYDRVRCGRCGKELHSTEKLTPPWEVQEEMAKRRAEIFLFARGLHPMQEPLLLRALSEFFLKREEGHEAAPAR